ncbi:MAG: WYL domain-containing protein [Candidatus Gastranaerophilales bacterium]|nr:WYL domain-containing protein [Candidatus Gastranaerophilales bacterium]
MSRLTKAEEIIQLAMLFQNSYSGLCIDDIKDHFECSRRSAERMKALLFDMFPEKIEEVQTNDKKKRWRFVKGTMNALISFTADDFANLEYLKGLSNDKNRSKDLDELIAKIKALTPQKNLRSLDTDISAILESEGFAVRQYSRIKADAESLGKLREALLAFKKIQFKYFIDTKEKTITLSPYGIIISDKYYLVGFNEYVNDLRLYLVDKIKDLVILDEYFERDESFSLNKYCNNSFGIYQEKPLDITLEFNKYVAEDVLNYHFHPSQKINEQDNGNIQVKFTSGGTYAIYQELFKWGCDVKIVKPTKLKENYKKYLQDVLDNF